MLQAKGTTSLMIDEYADIVQQIEALTRRKDEIRETLGKKKQFQEANKIQSKTGIVLTITVRRGSEIAPDLSEVKYLFDMFTIEFAIGTTAKNPAIFPDRPVT